MVKPRVFVGSASSKQGLAVARAIQRALEQDADVTIWEQGVFTPSLASLESLERQLDVSDAGVLVFTPEDDAMIKEETAKVVRDNVLFELGLFIGRVGRTRSFFVMPRGIDMHIPSDLTGITALEYDASRPDNNLVAAVGPACDKIRGLILPDDAMSSAPSEEDSLLRGTVWVKEDGIGTIVFLDDSHFVYHRYGAADWRLCRCTFEQHLNSVVLNWGSEGKNYAPRCSIGVGMRELREPQTSAGRAVFIWRRITPER